MTDSVLHAFLRGFTKRAGAPEPARGPIPQAKGKLAVVEPAGASVRPMDKAQKAVAKAIGEKAHRV